MRAKAWLCALLCAALLAGCAAPGGSSSVGSSAGDVSPGGSESASQSAPPHQSVQPPAPPAGPNVQVDWSKLEGTDAESTPWQADVTAGRWFAQPTDHLIPGEDYGELLPYVGERAYTVMRWEDEQGNQQVWTDTYPSFIYGLMTRDGRIVVDPVYQNVTQPTTVAEGEIRPLPILLLTQAREEWSGENNGQRMAVCALDGSWCTDFIFWECAYRGEEMMLVGPEGVTRLDSTGAVRTDWTWEQMGVEAELIPQILENIQWVMGCQWVESGFFLGMLDMDTEQPRVRLFQPETQQLVFMPLREFEQEMDRWYQERWGAVSGEQSGQVTFREGSVCIYIGEESYEIPMQVGLDTHFRESAGNLAILWTYDNGESEAILVDLAGQREVLRAHEIEFLRERVGAEKALYLAIRDEEGGLSLHDLELQLILEIPGGGGEWTSAVVDKGLVSVWKPDFSGVFDPQAGEWLYFRSFLHSWE